MAELIGAVWLPTIVAAVVVFLGSWVFHVLLPHHKNDYGRLPDEDGFMASMRSAGLSPGQYAFPHATGMEAYKDPAFVARCEEGPVGVAVVGPNGMPNMNKMLIRHFLYCLVVSFFAGYVAYAGIAPGSDYLDVFRLAGVTAFVAYSAAHVSASVWYFQTWSTTWKYVIDGLVYGLLTAGVFGWLMA